MQEMYLYEVKIRPKLPVIGRTLSTSKATLDAFKQKHRLDKHTDYVILRSDDGIPVMPKSALRNPLRLLCERIGIPLPKYYIVKIVKVLGKDIYIPSVPRPVVGFNPTAVRGGGSP